jgi:hypothetical protein
MTISEYEIRLIRDWAMLLPVLIISSLVHVYSISYLQNDPRDHVLTILVNYLLLTLTHLFKVMLIMFYFEPSYASFSKYKGVGYDYFYVDCYIAAAVQLLRSEAEVGLFCICTIISFIVFICCWFMNSISIAGSPNLPYRPLTPDFWRRQALE